MKTFLVVGRMMDPYPKEFSERVEAGSLGLAAYRAFKAMRPKHFAKRPIRKITLEVTLLSSWRPETKKQDAQVQGDA